MRGRADPSSLRMAERLSGKTKGGCSLRDEFYKSDRVEPEPTETELLAEDGTGVFGRLRLLLYH